MTKIEKQGRGWFYDSVIVVVIHGGVNERTLSDDSRGTVKVTRILGVVG